MFLVKFANTVNHHFINSAIACCENNGVARVAVHG
jgi:hypothetical protein